MGEIQIILSDFLGESKRQEGRRDMIKSVLSVGGILLFVAMFLYFMANPIIALNLIGMGIGIILKNLAQFFSYLAGLI